MARPGLFDPMPDHLSISARCVRDCTCHAGGAHSSRLATGIDRILKIDENQSIVEACAARAKNFAGLALCAGLAVLLAPQCLPSSAWAKEAPASDSCAPKGGSHSLVTSIDDRLELTLADGRLLRIGGLEAAAPTPGDADLGARGHDWLAAWLEQQDILYELLDARPDRWGRYPAVVFAAPVSGDATPISVGERLVREGFARVAPDQHKNPCEKRLLEAEKAARTAELGLWKDPYYKIIEAGDAAAFTEHAGSFILAEGRVSEIRDGSVRKMLFFGPHRQDHLAVTIMQRNVKIFEAAGLHFHGLIGQTLLVRGLLETRFGPEIEVTNPSEVEFVADGPSETAKPMQEAPAKIQP
jgi:endonuclease YncB( thermonuclease family)